MRRADCRAPSGPWIRVHNAQTPTSEVDALSERMLRSRSPRFISILSSSASIALSFARVSCSSLTMSLRFVSLLMSMLRAAGALATGAMAIAGTLVNMAR